MSGWFLQSIEIEGFRGINNEGDPLTLRFKDDCVSSISAPKAAKLGALAIRLIARSVSRIAKRPIEAGSLQILRT